MTTAPLTDQQLADTQAELAPLARVIAITLKATPVRLGDPADLIAALTLQVAAYMGPLVGDVPAELDRLGAELGRVRAELATAQQRIDAVLALDFADREQLEQMDPEQYHHADGYGDAIFAVQVILTDPAVPSA